MFEKEGIKYAIEETVGTECLSMPIEDFHFIDLAESQQEKAQCFKDGAEFGYNKANEWHYVKDGDLPINKNDGTTYLLYTIYGEGGSPVVAHFWGRDKQELMNIWTGAILTEDKIVAWKEIVLPKEIKENDI